MGDDVEWTCPGCGHHIHDIDLEQHVCGSRPRRKTMPETRDPLAALLAGKHHVAAVDVSGSAHEYEAFINDSLAGTLATAVLTWLTAALQRPEVVRVFRRHRPVGAYLPVGQLDGDCSCGRGAWPCAAIPGALALIATVTPRGVDS